MSERIILDVPDLLLSRARGVASYTSQPLEHVLLTWLQQAAQDVPVEVLSDAQVLELRDRQMDRQQQDRLHVCWPASASSSSHMVSGHSLISL